MRLKKLLKYLTQRIILILSLLYSMAYVVLSLFIVATEPQEILFVMLLYVIPFGFSSAIFYLTMKEIKEAKK
jgi:hypothetical protein